MLRRTKVDFSKKIRAWDGFGVNYVEVAQTRDYDADPQEYGGFSLLTDVQRSEIIDLIFGEDGLKPGLVKMFLDCFHQDPPAEGYDYSLDVIDPGVYDHDKTTRWMNTFVREGLRTTRAAGRDLDILGIDIIREQHPGLHAWVTSTSWSRMDVWFIDEIRNNIYSAKVNGIIPWACIQRPGGWVGGDPNPGTAIRVYDDGHYEVMPGYYFFKQVCRVGQPGMDVTRVVSNDSEIGLIGFAGNDTGNPDGFVVLNVADHPVPLTLDVVGTDVLSFEAHRTSPDEAYVTLGDFALQDGKIPYTAPAGSVTTFTGKVSGAPDRSCF